MNVCEPAVPRPASSVILVRRRAGGAGEGLEVYMTRRRVELRFLGGFHVFPGGVVDEGDVSEGTLARCRGLTSQQAMDIFGEEAPSPKWRGHWIAAARELFEEAGVLLAEDGDGRGVGASRQMDSGSVARLRRKLNLGEISFCDLLVAEGLFVSARRLHYLSHWVTPEFSPMRYDTRFFVTLLPEGQVPVPDPGEVDVGEWLDPTEAISMGETGRILLIPPTIAGLQAVARHTRWEDLVASLPGEG